MRRTAIVFCFICVASGVATAQDDKNGSITNTVVEAFQAVRDGWSSDEVLLQDALYKKFISECKLRRSDVDSQDFAWALLNLRKAGRLEGKTTRRGERAPAALRHIAEIAARHMEDKYQANMDRVICSPVLRAEFDRLGGSMAPEADAYLLRKSAFGLRKARRLRPELVLRVADWQRTVSSISLLHLEVKPQAVAATPGIYLFRDASGYLYIGESADVRKRLKQHLIDEPTSLKSIMTAHKIDLSKVTVEVHAFPADSPAQSSRVRRAYESDLIASRKPRFNIRP